MSKLFGQVWIIIITFLLMKCKGVNIINNPTLTIDGENSNKTYEYKANEEKEFICKGKNLLNNTCLFMYKKLIVGADNLVSVSRKPVILEDTISGWLQLSNETKEVYCIARIYVSKIHSCTNIDDSRNYTTSALIKIELNLEGTTSNTATAATATSATEKPITVLQNATENNQSTSNPTSTKEPDFIKDLEKKEFPTIIVIISTAAILVLFLLLTFIYCCCRKRCKRNIEIAKPEESTKSETAQDAIYAIPETVTYATLQLATSSNQVLSNKDVTQYAEVIGQLVPKKKYKI